MNNISCHNAPTCTMAVTGTRRDTIQRMGRSWERRGERGGGKKEEQGGKLRLVSSFMKA